MNSPENVLEIENLGHRYAKGDCQVLNGICFSVGKSKLVSVQGASGCGKTTLLMACGAMQKPTTGTVKINRTDVFSLSMDQRSQFRAKQIGYLFQTLQLVPYLNVLDNVRIVQGVTGDTARDWLSKLGLLNRLSHKPDALSHGQRQRVALARAIVHCPSLIIADEPTGNLDAENSRLVFKTLREFANKDGAVLVATHDSVVAEYADQTLQIESGRIDKAKAPA